MPGREDDDINDRILDHLGAGYAEERLPHRHPLEDLFDDFVGDGRRDRPLERDVHHPHREARGQVHGRPRVYGALILLSFSGGYERHGTIGLEEKQPQSTTPPRSCLWASCLPRSASDRNVRADEGYPVWITPARRHMKPQSKRAAAKSIVEGFLAGLFGNQFGVAKASVQLVDALIPDLKQRSLIENLIRNIDAKVDKKAFSDREIGTAQAIVRDYFRGPADLRHRSGDDTNLGKVLLERGAVHLRSRTNAEQERIASLVHAFIAAYRTAPGIEELVQTLSHREAVLDRLETLARSGEALSDIARLWLATDLFEPGPPGFRRVLAPDTPPQPSVMLNAAYEVVPFWGRTDELEELDQFRKSDPDFAVLLVEGPGGIGKTRLLLEATRRARLDGWRSGFLRRDLSDDALERGLFELARSTKPTLLVIDYAEDRPAQVAMVLTAWVSEAPQTRRVVLLSRHKSLVERTLRQEQARYPKRHVALDYFLGGRLRSMAPTRLEIALADRPAVFAAAQEAFAAISSADRGHVLSAPDLSADFFDQPHFARALYLHMAALAALSGQAAASKDALLRYVLDREDDINTRVLKTATDLNRTVTGAQLRPVLALATLATAARASGAPPPTAASLLDATTLGRVLDDLERLALSQFLAKLYPLLDGSTGPGAMDALRPDALGEGLVYFALSDDPTLATYALAAERDTASLASAATVLVRAALALEDDDPEAWLRTHLPPLQKRPRLVRAFNDSIHINTSRLRTLAASFAHWLVPHAQQTLDDNPDDVGAQRSLAQALNWQGIRFAQQGDSDAALAAMQKANALYRALAQRDTDAFEPYLAISLHNLGIVRSNLGSSEDALQATEEAVTIRRRLAQRNPDTFEPHLASSLNSLSADLTYVDRSEEALQAAEEAVTIHRRLALSNPDAFEPDLALSLDTLSVMRSNLGRHGDALTASEEAVELYQRLALRNPDAFEPDLARSLNNLGIRYSDLYRREEAVQAAEEAVTIRRRLALRNPDAFEPDLANTLRTLGYVHNSLDEYEAALGPLTEGLRLLLPRFESRPAAHAPQIQGALNDYRQACEGAGQNPDATLIDRIINILERL